MCTKVKRMIFLETTAFISAVLSRVKTGLSDTWQLSKRPLYCMLAIVAVRVYLIDIHGLK